MPSQEFVSVWVRDPRIQKEDFWHSYIDYEICIHSHLNSEDIEACVSGQTKYSVEEAIHKFALMNRRFPEEDEEGKKDNDVDYDSESSSSGLGHSSDDSSSHGCKATPALQES
ncbi:Sorting nexin-10 [Microtus ochrogaster]|uniref:Sorting nexin-10 n=1 Tax=Microtus ochrogaster TaxID=79684 RepID=A0A8J6GDT9_MICOH|nr:Sorting nexin-10 [Microtus ochrogaster]